MSIQPPAERVLRAELAETDAATTNPICPVDRLPRRRRNQVCIAIIALGAVNFLAYTLSYALLGGDAHNGEVRSVEDKEGTAQQAYFLRGHFIR